MVCCFVIGSLHLYPVFDFDSTVSGFDGYLSSAVQWVLGMLISTMVALLKFRLCVLFQWARFCSILGISFPISSSPIAASLGWTWFWVVLGEYALPGWLLFWIVEWFWFRISLLMLCCFRVGLVCAQFSVQHSLPYCFAFLFIRVEMIWDWLSAACYFVTLMLCFQIWENKFGISIDVGLNMEGGLSCFCPCSVLSSSPCSFTLVSVYRGVNLSFVFILEIGNDFI